MRSQNHPIILFIDRLSFSVYQDVANIAKFNFTPDLVSNLDVVDKQKFTDLIATFIQINKIVPGNLTVVLSDNAIYIKDLVNSTQKPTSAQGLTAEAQNFLENIPFEDVLAKIIKTGGADRIVAVNKDLVMTIIDAFLGKGAVLGAVIPGFMYGQSANFTAGLNLNNVRAVLENEEALRSGNLLTNQEKMIPSGNSESELNNQSSDVRKPQRLRQYILIGVFIVLLVILAVVYLRLGVSQPTASTIDTPALRPASVSTVTQKPIVPAPTDPKSIKIKIIQGSQANEKAISLKSGLSGIGLTDIASEISEVMTAEKSSVIFSQSIPTDLRSNIIAEVRKILPEISILENQDSELKITVLIGKS